MHCFRFLWSSYFLWNMGSKSCLDFSAFGRTFLFESLLCSRFCFSQRVKKTWWVAKIRKKLFKISGCFKSWEVVFFCMCLRCFMVMFRGLVLSLCRIVKGRSAMSSFILWDRKKKNHIPNRDFQVELSMLPRKIKHIIVFQFLQDTSAMPSSRHTSNARFWTKELPKEALLPGNLLNQPL